MTTDVRLERLNATISTPTVVNLSLFADEIILATKQATARGKTLGDTAEKDKSAVQRSSMQSLTLEWITAVVLKLFHCWDPLNATDVVWDPQVKIEKVCAPQ